MNITNSVLVDVRNFLNVGKDSDAFDGEIIPHIIASLGTLSQNGVAVPRYVDTQTTWVDVISPEMVVNTEVFAMLPLFVMMNTKLFFDPPPPSSAEYYKGRIDEMLWRLRVVYNNREEVVDE